MAKELRYRPIKSLNALAYFLKCMIKTDHWSAPGQSIRRKCHQNTERKHNLSVTLHRLHMSAWRPTMLKFVCGLISPSEKSEAGNFSDENYCILGCEAAWC